MKPKTVVTRTDRSRLVQRALGILGTVVTVVGGAITGADTAQAEVGDPYPELRYFTQIDAEPYRLPGQGLWFTTPLGLNCGIWWRGSFGCTGQIPGAPADVHHIGWITGDTRVHYDWTMAVRFPPARGARELPPLSFIESEGTKCATTVNGGTYCERGPWRMNITPEHTWLNG